MFPGEHKHSVSLERTDEENRQRRSSNQAARQKASTNDLLDIDQLIADQPDIMIDEIIEKQGLSVSNATVRKAVIKLGYVYKKKFFLRGRA